MRASNGRSEERGSYGYRLEGLRISPGESAKLEVSPWRRSAVDIVSTIYHLGDSPLSRKIQKLFLVMTTKMARRPPYPRTTPHNQSTTKWNAPSSRYREPIGERVRKVALPISGNYGRYDLRSAFRAATKPNAAPTVNRLHAPNLL